MEPDVSATTGSGRRWYLLPGYAGLAYVAAWAVGLAVWPQNLPLNATGSQVAAGYRLHPAGAVAQYLLAEALAGLLLGIVLAAALIFAEGRRAVRSRLVAATATAAVVTSLAQSVLGMFLIAAATGDDAVRAGILSDLVNRLDGVKMLALAVVGLYLASRGLALRRTPAWIRVIAALTAAALTLSGLGYLTLSAALAWAVFISGPLLLLWIAGTGILLTRQWRASSSRLRAIRQLRGHQRTGPSRSE
jgi:hypothetical protein